MPGHVKYRPDSGKWRARYPNLSKGGTAQIERTFRTKREADEWLVQQQASILNGAHIAPREGDRRFRDVYESWRDTKWPALQPKTTARYGQVWRTYLEPEFGARKLNTITRELVKRYFAKLSHDGVAPGTVRKVHAVMSAIMGEAIDNGYVKANPCTGVKLIRPAHREMLYLTAGELLTLANAVTPYYRTLVLFAGYTGMRSSEVTGLRWRNVDLLHGRLIVAEALKEVGGELVFGPTKTHETRTVSLPRFLGEMLREHGVGAPDELVFPGPQGGPMRHHLFYRRHFRPAVVRALPHKSALRFHDLRHTCAALLIGHGAHPKLIQTRLGHSSITITLDTYGHMFPSVEAALAEQLDAVYNAAGDPDNVRGLRKAE